MIPFLASPTATTGRYQTQTSGIAVPTSTYNATDLLRIPEVDPEFKMINDGSFMLYQLLQMFAKGTPSKQPRYEFFEDDILPVMTTSTVEYASGATEIIVSEAICSAKTNLFVPSTGEIIRVTSASGATLTVTRGHRGTSAATVAAGAELYLIGQDLPEGGSAGLGVSQLPTKDWNAISFYSTGWKVTDVQEYTNMLNGVGQFPREQKMQILKMMREIDADLRWGKRAVDASTASSEGTLYYTDGFNSRVTSHVIELAGDLTWDDLNEAFLPVFDDTSSSVGKQFLLGQELYSEINRIARDKVSPVVYDQTLGSNVSRIELDGGYTLDLILDKHGFRGETSSWGFIIDALKAEFIPFDGFDMVIRDVTPVGSHSPQVELFTSASMKLIHEQNNAVVKRV